MPETKITIQFSPTETINLSSKDTFITTVESWDEWFSAQNFFPDLEKESEQYLYFATPDNGALVVGPNVCQHARTVYDSNVSEKKKKEEKEKKTMEYDGKTYEYVEYVEYVGEEEAEEYDDEVDVVCWDKENEEWILVNDGESNVRISGKEYVEKLLRASADRDLVVCVKSGRLLWYEKIAKHATSPRYMLTTSHCIKMDGRRIYIKFYDYPSDNTRTQRAEMIYHIYYDFPTKYHAQKVYDFVVSLGESQRNDTRVFRKRFCFTMNGVYYNWSGIDSINPTRVSCVEYDWKDEEEKEEFQKRLEKYVCE